MKFLSGIFFFALLLLIAVSSYAQQADKYVYPVKADTLTLRDTAELIIENSTKDSIGYLYNRGNGRTEFRKLKLEMVAGGSKVALTSQDTISISAALPQSVAPRILTTATCQTWDGSRNIIKKGSGDVYLKLDVTAQLLDDREILVANLSGSTGGTLIIYSYGAKIRYHNGLAAQAIRVNNGSRLRLIYDQPTNFFYIIGWYGFDWYDDTIVNVTNGPCPQ